MRVRRRGPETWQFLRERGSHGAIFITESALSELSRASVPPSVTSEIIWFPIQRMQFVSILCCTPCFNIKNSFWGECVGRPRGDVFICVWMFVRARLAVRPFVEATCQLLPPWIFRFEKEVGLRSWTVVAIRGEVGPGGIFVRQFGEKSGLLEHALRSRRDFTPWELKRCLLLLCTPPPSDAAGASAARCQIFVRPCAVKKLFSDDVEQPIIDIGLERRCSTTTGRSYISSGSETHNERSVFSHRLSPITVILSLSGKSHPHGRVVIGPLELAPMILFSAA